MMMAQHDIIRRHLESIKEPPISMSVVQSILDLSKESKVNPSQYANVIGADPYLSSKILSYVNSAYFAPAHPIRSVDMAVTRLGVVATPTIAINFVLKSIYEALKLPPLVVRECWISSIFKASAAKLLT